MAIHLLDDETRRLGRWLHYAGALLTVLCATAGYALFLAPVLHEAANAEQQIAELSLLAENAPAIRENHRQVSHELEQVVEQIAQVRGRVPQDADAGTFLKAVAQIAGEEQLTIKQFRPETPVTRSGYVEIEVSLKGEGSFASICTFFDRLSRLPRLSKVKSLTLSAHSDSAEYPMEATLIIYSGLRDPEPGARKEVGHG